jgi:hypothetical protein
MDSVASAGSAAVMGTVTISDTRVSDGASMIAAASDPAASFPPPQPVDPASSATATTPDDAACRSRTDRLGPPSLVQASPMLAVDVRVVFMLSSAPRFTSFIGR